MPPRAILARPRPRLLGAALAVLLAGCGAGEGAPPNVVLVTIDTLRADHLTPYGHSRDTSPFLAELAEESVLFEDAISQCGTTPQSLSSLMTGLFPYTDGAVERNDAFYYLGRQNETLATILRDRGYRTHAITSSIQSSRATGMEHGFETFDGIELGADGRKSARRNAADIVELASGWLAEQRDDGRPFFLWLHLLDPHHPYRPPHEYDALFADEAPREEGETRTYRFDARHADAYPLSDGELERLVLAYDREIRFVDDSLRGLFEGALRPHLEDTLVVLTSDHGEALGHRRMVNHNDLYQPILHVPLLVRPPGAHPAGRRVPDPVMLVDVLPTIADYLGVELPGAVRGSSLRPLAERRASLPADRLRVAEYDFQAVLRGDYKLIARPEGRELFDLARDGAEVENLAGTRDDLSTELLYTGLRLREDPLGASPTTDAARTAVTPAMVEELRALGYAEE